MHFLWENMPKPLMGIDSWPVWICPTDLSFPSSATSFNKSLIVQPCETYVTYRLKAEACQIDLDQPRGVQKSRDRLPAADAATFLKEFRLGPSVCEHPDDESTV